MSEKRRFNEQEIAAIFKQAAEAQEADQHAELEGLTLAELQAIGAEVGITPAHIARFAASIGKKGKVDPPKRFLGLPVGVSYSATLSRPLKDEEWDRLVVSIRETFEARGSLSSEASLKAWRNGNLHVLAEPTEHGQRLRMQTQKGNAKPSLLWSLLAFLLPTLLLILLPDNPGSVSLRFLFLSLIAMIGAVRVGITAWRLPKWAKTRIEQMEALSDQAQSLIAESTPLEFPVDNEPQIVLDTGDEKTQKEASSRSSRKVR